MTRSAVVLAIVVCAAGSAAAAEPTPTPSPAAPPSASPTPAAMPAVRGLTLAQAYHLALQSNEELKEANVRVDQALVERLLILENVRPTITLDASGIVQNAEKNLQTPGYGSGGATLAQPLFYKGLHAGLQSVDLAVAAAKSSAERAKQQLMIDTVTTFFAVLRARQQVQLAQGAIDRANTSLEAAQARVKAGGALRTSVLLAALDQRRAQIGLVDAKRALEAADADFQRLFRMPPPETLVVPPTPSAPPVDIAMMRAQNRADYKALQLAVTSSQARRSYLHARIHSPRLDLKGTAAYLDPTYFPNSAGTKIEQGGLLTYTAGLYLSIPIHDPATYEPVRAQDLETQQADLEVSRLKQVIQDDVRQAAAQLDAAQQTASIAKEQVKDARENYDLVEGQFKLGAATPLEVANAQAALVEAENLDVVSQYDQQIAAYQLLFASGLLQL